MSIWFEGEQDIDCTLEDVKAAVADPGVLFTGVVARMPGLRDVELVEQSGDVVTIRTNEGLMTRSSITTKAEADRVVLDLDERYEAGSKVTTTSHVTDEFVATGGGVRYHLTIRDLEATGFLGFLFRHFGRRSTGKAFLAAYNAQLGRGEG